MEEYTEDQYKYDLTRMLDSYKAEGMGGYDCGGVKCFICRAKAVCRADGNELSKVRIVKEWAKEHPEPHVETNVEHFEKEFGHKIYFQCFASPEKFKSCRKSCRCTCNGCSDSADAPYMHRKACYMNKEIVDCHYCNYGFCADSTSKVDCYCADGEYFDHEVTDPKEAENCIFFMYCDSFPKW